LLIILVVLALVYWLPPGIDPRGRVVRRTAADVGLTLAVIILAVVWMQGAGVLLGPGYLGVIGAFSPQTQIVPILIVGLGVDFAIHLLARYRTETASSVDPVRGLAIAARTTGPTLLLCTAATAIGFLTNLASPVDFLATLGVLAAVGIAAAFVLTMTLLPAARIALDRRAADRDRLPVAALDSSTSRSLPQLIGRTAWLAQRAPVPTLIAAGLVVVLGSYGFTQLDTEFELTDFVPQDEPLLETLATLTDVFGGGFEETTQILLVGDVDAARGDGMLDAAVARLIGVDNVEQLGQRPDATVTISEDGRIGRIEVRTSAAQGGASRLESDLTRAMAPLSDAGVEVTVASQQIVQARIGEDIEDSQIASLLIALAAAMALLAVHYGATARRPVLGVITVAPVVLVLAATFGTMAVTGIPLNAVTATLAALSIGIGVPFTIHVTARFMEERQRDGDPVAAMSRTVAATGGALAGSALTTAIGFGVLVTSTLKPFEQLGYVIVYAIVYSFVAAVLVLPSMLVLWARRQRA
ncbi:MAG: MMPL family transporter, partial [Nitriliruptoraceae bacterium]